MLISVKSWVKQYIKKALGKGDCMGTYYKTITFIALLNFNFFMQRVAVSFPAENSSDITLGSLGKKKLEKIYKIIGQEHNIKEAKEIFDLMSGPWSEYDREIKWENNLTDDCSPFEYSITFKGTKTTPIIRFLVEPQELPLNKESNWKAGLTLKERIKKLPNVDISKLDKIENIFSPSTTQNIQSHFSIWYAAVLEPNNPQIKVYLNPQIRGEKSAPELVKKALLALNAENAWKFISDHLYLSKIPSKMIYFSLDLSADHKTARTKVYIANKSLREIEAKLLGCLHYVKGSASKWVKILTNQGSFDKKPILITYNFTSEQDRPIPTIHTPIRSYAKNDEMAIERLREFLSPEQIKTLKAIIVQISEAPLKDEKALTYVSLRPSADGQLDVTCYIAPCIYSKNENKKSRKGESNGK